MVDAGFKDAATRDDWQSALAGLGHPPIARLVVTHSHADHAKAAGWFCQVTGTPLVMPLAEWAACRRMQQGRDNLDWIATARQLGLAEDQVQTTVAYRRAFAEDYADFPALSAGLADGQHLAAGARDWQVITGGGHSADMAGLYCAADRILIAADHVLPYIVAILPKTAANPDDQPITRQFDLLSRLEALPLDTLVLPSHGEPFTGLHQRIAVVRAKMSDELDRIHAAITSPVTVWQILNATWKKPPLPGQEITAGTGLLAQLDHLVAEGRLRRDEAEVPLYGPA